MTDVGSARAARATLIALRAMLPEPGAVDGSMYALLPSQQLWSVERIVERLVAMPKPVACIALAHANCLAIACWPSSAERVSQIDDLRSYGTRFLLKGHRESLALSPEEVDLWWTQYELLLPEMHITSDTPEVRGRGVDAMIVYRPRR